MFNQENVAAAQLAHIFGSELLKVQNNAITDSGSPPEIVKLDPKKFLVDSAQAAAAQKSRERQIIESLQREAEAAYPVPSSFNGSTEENINSTSSSVSNNIDRSSQNIPKEDFINSWANNNSSISSLERIACALEKIASVFNTSSIEVRKKKTKRKSSLVKTPKTILNENNV
jgi:hypothetical protein